MMGRGQVSHPSIILSSMKASEVGAERGVFHSHDGKPAS